jgi:hypothetical protein
LDGVVGVIAAIAKCVQVMWTPFREVPTVDFVEILLRSLQSSIPLTTVPPLSLALFFSLQVYFSY